MAGAGYKLFNTGDVLTAAQVNTYLMEQTVMVFADAAARTAALSGVVSEGMISYLKDTNAVEVYNGSAWVASDDPNAIQNTIVDAKGDLITATAADTPARLAVGNNGETLVADSSASVGLRYQEPKAGNPVINSAFQVWQRGTTGTITSGYGYPSADRWNAWTLSAGGSMTVSRQTTNDTTNLPNIQYCARVQRPNGNTSTSTLILGQAFETANSIPFAGKTVTISFYARKGANYSAASSLLNLQLWSNTTTDAALNTMFSGKSNAIATTLTLTSTWQRFTATGTISTTATQIAPVFYYEGVGTAGADDYYEITGIQLEVGSVATPFKTQGVTLAGELQAAQRYYWRNTSGETLAAMSASMPAGSTTEVDHPVVFPVPMRVRPTSLDYSGLSTYDGTTNYTTGTYALIGARSGTQFATVRYTHGSAALTQYRPYQIIANSSATAYIGLSAEL